MEKFLKFGAVVEVINLFCDKKLQQKFRNPNLQFMFIIFFQNIYKQTKHFRTKTVFSSLTVYEKRKKKYFIFPKLF